jgi:predicted transcriptional regulator
MELLQMDARSAQSRRSSLEIMGDILDVVSSGTERPTHIIYRANISWKVLNGCLRTLITNELITKTSDGKREVYKLTDKGYSVLNLYRELKDRLQPAGSALSVDLFARGF